MRVAGAGLGVGSLTLAGLPLTAGFVSEWFILEALMQQFRVGTLIYALPLEGAGALVALTVGFGAVGFVRIVGLVVLGPRDDENVAPRADGGLWAAPPIALLGTACVAMPAVAPLEVRVLATGLEPVAGPEALAGALKEPWVLQPVYAEFSALSPSWFAVAMPVLLLAVLAVAAAFGGRRLFTVRRVPAWRSATMGSPARINTRRSPSRTPPAKCWPTSSSPAASSPNWTSRPAPAAMPGWSVATPAAPTSGTATT